MFQAPRSSRMVRQCLALAVGTALTASLGVSPAHAVSTDVLTSSNTSVVAAELSLPEQAFEYGVTGAGVGALGAFTLAMLLGKPSEYSLMNWLTFGSFSTLAGALASSAGHFHAGEPLRGVGLGVSGSGLIIGAAFGGVLLADALTTSSAEALAAGAFIASCATLVGWTRFMAADAQNVAAQRWGAPLSPAAPR